MHPVEEIPFFRRQDTELRKTAIQHDPAIEADNEHIIAAADEHVFAALGRDDFACVMNDPSPRSDFVGNIEGFRAFISRDGGDENLRGVELAAVEVFCENTFVPATFDKLRHFFLVFFVGRLLFGRAPVFAFDGHARGFAVAILFEIVKCAHQRATAGSCAAFSLWSAKRRCQTSQDLNPLAPVFTALGFALLRGEVSFTSP